MIAFVFPGQGSQKKGMGETLFAEFPELTAKADEILGYSIMELCVEDPGQKLGLTQYTQPALYIVNVLSYLHKTGEMGQKPDYLVGHSLGEYSALFAAGVFDFGTGLKLVQKRGELMSHASGGGMAAVIGLSNEQVAEVLREHQLSMIDVANDNSPFQIVISGPKEEIQKAQVIFEELKAVKMFTPLKTSGAFHSRYMEVARKEFGFFLEGFHLSAPTIPVVSNVEARPYHPSKIKQNLTDQITHPVKWTESIRYLMGLGVSEFEEVGPGRVLTGLIQRIKKEAEPLLLPVAETVETANADVLSKSPDSGDAGEVLPPVLVAVQPESSALEINITDETTPAPGSVLGEKVTGVLKNVREKAKDLVSATGEKITKATNALKTGKEKRSKVENKAAPNGLLEISPSALGSASFRKDYHLKFAYVTGGMYGGIASKEMVAKLGKAGMLGFLGTEGLELRQVDEAIRYLKQELAEGGRYGVNLFYHPHLPETEEKLVDLLLQHEVHLMEASAFLSITPALVKYRAKGLRRDPAGKMIVTNKIIAKVSRPEVAERFLSPAPERILTKLVAENKITREEADFCKTIPVADDICAVADAGGYTDGGSVSALLPAILKLRDERKQKYQYQKQIHVGAGGGIGTPEAAAAAFILGADFILTGSVNQCTVEAMTSEMVKDQIQQMNVQDTGYAPGGDMFELGSRVQVLKKGLFYPSRANKLYDLYRQYNSWEEIDEKTRVHIQEKYFKKSFEQVYQEAKSTFPPLEVEKAERNPKTKMALIFRWYFSYSMWLAIKGDAESKVDYQVFCGPALGAFNQWVKGTDLEDWRNRHVDEIGIRLMTATAELLTRRIKAICMSAGIEKVGNQE